MKRDFTELYFRVFILLLIVVSIPVSLKKWPLSGVP